MPRSRDWGQNLSKGLVTDGNSHAATLPPICLEDWFICLGNLCIKVLLWFFLPAVVLRENSGSQCYRICTTLGSHQKISWRYFTLWNWEDSGLASGSQTCCVSLVLGLSRFMESCLYFLKCYTCSDKPLFSF